MADPIINDSQGLLSRLGQWFKSGHEGQALESTGALTIGHRPEAADELTGGERQKRKALVDQVRKLEFAELRGLLNQVTRSVEPSEMASTRHTNTQLQQRHARAYTREKIDTIEEQMSKSWYASSMTSGQDSPYGASRGTVNGKAQTEAPASVQRVMRVSVQNEMRDFAYPPEAVNASIAFAIGDYISAERILTGLCNRRDRLDRLVTSWELRFELYLSINKKAEFEDASVDFAAKFGKSPPLWRGPWGSPEVAPSPQRRSLPEASSSQNLQLSAHLDLEGVHRLLQRFSEAKLTGIIRIDWAHLKSIDVEVLTALAALFDHCANWPGRVEFAGHPNLLDRLNRQALEVTPDQHTQKRWIVLLSYLRLTGDELAFENKSIEYCVHLEETAPVWTTPKCEFMPLPSATFASFQSEDRDFEPTRLLAEDAQPPPSGEIQIDELKRSIFLKETLKGNIRAAFLNIPSPSPDKVLCFECEELVRIDAQAAGHLLHFLRQEHFRSSQVRFRRIHRLVSIYLFSLGLPPNITLELIAL